MPKKVKVLDIQFDVCTKGEALERIFECLESRPHESGKHIVTPNPEMILEAQKNKEFKTVLNAAWLSIPDGIGILWAAAFQKNAQRSSKIMRRMKAFISLLSVVLYPRRCTAVFPQRITGVDLMKSICNKSAEKRFSVFLLGAAPGVAEKAAEQLKKISPRLSVAGSYSGSPFEADFPAIQKQIEESQPDILFVAYGAPAQELWIASHIKKLKSVKIVMGVGGAFDFIAKIKKRAPLWMQKIGLEWLYRLSQEPRRIKRIYNAAVRFPLAVIKN